MSRQIGNRPKLFCFVDFATTTKGSLCNVIKSTSHLYRLLRWFLGTLQRSRSLSSNWRFCNVLYFEQRFVAVIFIKWNPGISLLNAISKYALINQTKFVFYLKTRVNIKRWSNKISIEASSNAFGVDVVDVLSSRRLNERDERKKYKWTTGRTSFLRFGLLYIYLPWRSFKARLFRGVLRYNEYGLGQWRQRRMI